MHPRKTLCLLLLLLLGLFSPLFAQQPSSVYHDAKRLADFISQDYEATLHFEDIQGWYNGWNHLLDVNFNDLNAWRARSSRMPDTRYRMRTGDRFIYFPSQSPTADSLRVSLPEQREISLSLSHPWFFNKSNYNFNIDPVAVTNTPLALPFFLYDAEFEQPVPVSFAWRREGELEAWEGIIVRKFGGSEGLWENDTLAGNAYTHHWDGTDYSEIHPLKQPVRSAGDSLQIMVGDRKLIMGWSPPKMPAAPNDPPWTNEEIILQIFTEKRVALKPVLRTLTLKDSVAGFHERIRSYNEGSKTAILVQQHTQVSKNQRADFTFSVEALRRQTAANPYLGPVLSSLPVFEDGLRDLNWAPSDYITKDIGTTYPWHAILYGDSILQLEKQVSLEDLTVGYRQPITSQRQLDLASTAINSNRNKGSLLDARTVAVGLSDFIAERAQEELNLTFFERFKENLDEPSELTVLFPKTRDLLHQFQISNYKTLLSFAKTAFQADLDNLGLNFPDILDLPKYQKLKNDPNVFNLSLIYSIANLAYQEYPVETIMLSANQQLRQRQQYLGAAIDAKLAGMRPSQLTRLALPGFSRASQPPLEQLAEEVEYYLDGLRTYYDRLEALDNRIDTTFQWGMIQFQPSFGGETTRQVEASNEWSLIQNRTSRSRQLRALKTNVPAVYQGRVMEDLSPLELEAFLLSYNLRGEAYYAPLIEQPRMGDYDRFFRGKEARDTTLVPQGLARLRSVLTTGESEAAHAKLTGLRKDLVRAQDIMSQFLLNQKDAAFADRQLLDLQVQADQVAEAISSEGYKWVELLGLPNFGRFRAGFEHLSSLARSLAMPQEDGPVGQLRDPNFVKRAYANLDTILVDFAHHRHQLLENYGQQPVSRGDYRKLVVGGDMERNMVELMKRAEQEMATQESTFQRILAGNEVDFNQDIDCRRMQQQCDSLQQLIDPDVPAADTDLLYQLDSLKYELTERQKMVLPQLSVEYDSLLKIKETLRGKAMPMIAAFEALQKDTLGQQQLVSVQSLWQDKPFPNANLEEYYRRRQQSTSVELPELADMRSLSAILKTLDEELAGLEQQRQEIISQLRELEEAVSPELVKARQNAQGVAKVMEVATHLLFAFRDYDRQYDPLYALDTVMVERSFTDTDSLTGQKFSRSFLEMRVDTNVIQGTDKMVEQARWLRGKDFNALRKDPVAWNVFLGLLYQRISSVEGGEDFAPEGVALMATKFFGIANEVDENLNRLRRKRALTPREVGFRDYYPFIRSTVDLFNTVITTPSIGDSTKTWAKQNKSLAIIPNISDEALSLYENIFVKNYSEAVLNSMELLKLLVENGIKDKKKRRKALGKVNGILRYGTFMAKVIGAESSDQVKAILRSQALPPGSSREKRESVSNFAINSYLGGSVGIDNLQGAPADFGETSSLGAALAVPVGFSYSFSPRFLKRSSFSFHVPLIDLGAITAYRQNPDNGDYDINDLPDFTWGNLLSPGLFAAYNFGNSPFTLAVGGQYGPQLREIIPAGAGPGAQALQVNSWRFPMVSFTIDVPLFRLHAGPEKIISD